MEKSADAFRTISEVAEDLDLPQHVLRFWETRFVQIKPLKRGGGRRYYRPDDVELLRAIRHLLYGEGYTIKGVQKILKEQGVRALTAASREVIERRTGGNTVPEAIGTSSAAEVWFEPNNPDLAERPEFGPHFTELEKQGGLDWSAPPGQPVHAAMDSPHGFRSPSMTAADRQLLEAVLADLAECTRLLDAARHG
jgi:DNA-binding transcriptional MerR regulator